LVVECAQVTDVDGPTARPDRLPHGANATRPGP